MFDIGWTEMALIAVVAVVVIGPKELPKVMRELGLWVSRARGLSRNFLDQLEEMSRQSGIDEVRKEVEAVRQLNPARTIEQAIDPEGVIKREAAELEKVGAPITPAVSPPATPSPTPASETALAAAEPPTPTVTSPELPKPSAEADPALPAPGKPTP
jgi:sec-independent protein translocase protein TatB